MNTNSIHALLAIALMVVLTIVALSTSWSSHRARVSVIGRVAIIGAATVVVHVMITMLRFGGALWSGWLLLPAAVAVTSLGLLAWLCLARARTERPTGWLVGNMVVTVVGSAIGVFFAMLGALAHMR